MSNPYYSPNDYGLVTIGQIEWYGTSYQFDLTVVWHRAGTFYWESDSGCSCPEPFRGFQSLEELRSGSAYKVIAELTARREAVKAETDDYGGWAVVELIGRILNVEPYMIDEYP